MHVSVIIPFHCQGDPSVLQWTLEGFAAQHLNAGHTMDVLVGVDGGVGRDMALPSPPNEHFKFMRFPRVGSAATRNALVRAADPRTDLLIFVNADTRPDPEMVQCHIETLVSLPPGSLVLGAAPFERRESPTVFDALVDHTPMVFAYSQMKPETWYDFRSAYALNLSIRKEQFAASGGFPEELRPRYFEDTVFAHRLLGTQQRVFYQPRARVLHRHPMTLDQYLDREEMLGMMAPTLARVAPESFSMILSIRASAMEMAPRYASWVVMDTGVLRDSYNILSQWAVQDHTRLGDAQTRALTLSALYQLHVPLKRLAFRLGFLRGMQLTLDVQWELRQAQHLWHPPLKSAS